MDYLVLNGLPDGSERWCVFDLCSGKCNSLTCSTNCPSNCSSNCSAHSTCTRLGCGQGGRVTPYKIFD